MTARRMTSDDVLKYLYGFFMPRRYKTPFGNSSQFPLTKPLIESEIRFGPVHSQHFLNLAEWAEGNDAENATPIEC